jgi:hypothetical protein
VEESGRRKGTCASLRSIPPPVLKRAVTIIFLQAKKNLEEREAEQEYSFTPVFYTKSGKESKTRPPEREPQSGSQTHKKSGHRTEHSSHRHRDHDDRPDERRRGSRDHAFYSPVGTGSVDSHGHSRYSEHSCKSQRAIRRPDMCYKHHVETKHRCGRRWGLQRQLRRGSSGREAGSSSPRPAPSTGEPYPKIGACCRGR